jgi:hypothetical protein
VTIKTIQTTAVINAEDKTGTTFAQVANKLKSLEATAQRASQTSLRAGETAARASKAAQASHMLSGAVGGLAAAGALWTVRLAKESIAAIGEAIGERVGEVVKMQVSGMSASDIEAGKIATAEIAKKYPSISQNDLLAMYRDTRSIVGNADEARGLMDSLAQLSVITAKFRPGENPTEGLEHLVKGLEIAGYTQDPKKFKSAMDQIARTIETGGHTISPEDLYEFAKLSRGAASGYSSQYLLGIAPSIVQELGGASAGKTGAAFMQAIIGGVMKQSALQEYVRLGLVNDADLIHTTTGSIKGLKPGKHIGGWQLAQQNPYQWVNQVLLPALKSHGITSQEDTLAEISRLFQTQTASQMVKIYATQQSRIEKDLAMRAASHGLAAAGEITAKDFSTQMQGVSNSFVSMGGTLGARLADNTGALIALSRGFSEMNVDLQKGRSIGESSKDALANLVFGDTAASLAKARQAAAEARRAYDKETWLHPLAKAADLASMLYRGNAAAMAKEHIALLKAYADAAPPPSKSSGHWLGNAPPVAGKFTPGVGAFKQVSVANKLSGSADVNVNMRVSLDPGLSASVTKNSRSDLGISMDPAEIMP